MKGWRSKLIFMFLLYFAGFATAVYFLAEPPATSDGYGKFQASIQKNFDSKEFIDSFNSGLHKSVEFGKGTALHLSKYIKEKTKDSELFDTSGD